MKREILIYFGLAILMLMVFPPFDNRSVYSETLPTQVLLSRAIYLLMGTRALYLIGRFIFKKR